MSSRISPFLRPILGFAVVLAWTGFIHGQMDDMESLRQAQQKNRILILNLLNGKEAFGEQQHKDALDVDAKWMTYRFTWVANFDDPGKMEQIHREFADHLKLVENNKNTRPVVAASVHSSSEPTRLGSP